MPNNQTRQVTHPSEVIAEALALAVKPFAKDLRTAAALDRELSKAVEGRAPHEVEARGRELFHRAAAGDTKAAAELGESMEDYCRREGEKYALAAAKHRAAALANVPLLAKLSAAVSEALDLADARIQSDFAGLLSWMECPAPAPITQPDGRECVLPRWRQECTARKASIARMVSDAERGVGVAWLLSANGMEELIK